MYHLPLLLGFLSVVLGQDAPVVNTNYGSLQGVRKSFEGSIYDVFMGVGYAAPPVGDLRWQKPQPPASWEGVREAIQFGNRCYTLNNENTYEDCLFLNVYVPNGADANTEPLPVMVFSHGGGFRSGSSNVHPSEELATYGQVIVVTYNYRLSTLGFLTTGDDNARGNYALWDQTAALKWVSENIAYFGGDAGRVTVFGQSAGSASISHLSLSPEANQYFHRVIPMSGSAAAYWATTRVQKEATRMMGLVMGCNILTNAALMRCLREKDPQMLEIYALVVPVALQFHLPNWVPIVDGDFHAAYPRDLMEAGYNANHDLMVGSTFHDAASFVHYGFVTLADTEFIRNTAFSFLFSFFSNPDQLYNLLAEEYPDLFNEDLTTRRQALVRMATDFIFTSPAVFEAREHARTSSSGKKTYLYEFKHNRSFAPPEQAPWIIADHSEELDFIFGKPHIGNNEFTEEERELNLAIMGYYANFAYTGNPNEGPHKVSVEWPEYNSDSREYLLKKPQLEVLKESEERVQKMTFWNDVFYPSLQPKNEDRMSRVPQFDLEKIELMMEKVKTWSVNGTDDLEDNVSQLFAHLLLEVVEGQKNQ